MRIRFPDATYHVFNRGICRKTIFYSVDDCNFFLWLVAEAQKKYKFKLYAYCLMPNHYHLCIKTPKPNINRIMQYITGIFARKVNSDIAGDGSVFKSRYKSLLVDTDTYLMRLVRYIHLNPVEAKLINDPEMYRWSSAKYYIDNAKTPKLEIESEEILSFFKDKKEYLEYLNLGNDKVIKEIYSRKRIPSILGSKSYIEKIYKQNKLQTKI